MDPDRLIRIKPFARLGARERAVIAARATEESVAAGTVLMREGDFAPDLIAVVDGSVAVTRGPLRIAELGPGEIVGEAGCLSGRMRNATVTATVPSRLMRLTHWDLRQLERAAPDALASIRALADERDPRSHVGEAR